jgi:hypothetical protein
VSQHPNVDAKIGLDITESTTDEVWSRVADRQAERDVCFAPSEVTGLIVD